MGLIWYICTGPQIVTKHAFNESDESDLVYFDQWQCRDDMSNHRFGNLRYTREGGFLEVPG